MMTVSHISVFESTVQLTEDWLNEVNAELGGDDQQQAYRILRAVLMALRDRLTIEEATDLGAQLPMLVRGFYYEGWNPSKTPRKERTLDSFLAHVAENLVDNFDGDPERATRAVFKVIAGRVTAGEVGHVQHCLPRDVQSLWP